MINDIDKVLNMFTKYSKAKPVIITSKDIFIKVNAKDRGFDIENQLNTYKGALVVLRDDLPNDNKIIVMEWVKFINLLKNNENFL